MFDTETRTALNREVVKAFQNCGARLRIVNSIEEHPLVLRVQTYTGAFNVCVHVYPIFPPTPTTLRYECVIEEVLQPMDNMQNILLGWYTETRLWAGFNIDLYQGWDRLSASAFSFNAAGQEGVHADTKKDGQVVVSFHERYLTYYINSLDYFHH